MNVQNPHDKFFKESLSNVSTAKDFLIHYLPEAVMKVVNVDTLEPQKDSFINQELAESFSDLLFKVDICNKDGYLYFLFEHKSYPDKAIAFQLLKYMVGIWESKSNKEQSSELPVVIPLVMYHGATSWRIPSNLGNLLSGYTILPDELKVYVPDFDFIVYDLSTYTNAEIKGSAQTRILITLLRDIFTNDSSTLLNSLLRSARYLHELEDKQTGIEYLETMIRYVFSAGKSITERDVKEIIHELETVYPEGSEVAMAMADVWKKEGMEKGIEKGMKKGIELGRAAALSEAALQVLIEKFGKVPQDIKEGIAKTDAAALQLLIVNSFKFEKIEEARKYIQ